MPYYTNATQSIPPLFKEIMRNHSERQALPSDGGMTRSQWHRLGALVREMKEFRRGAEKALCWNKDKGNTA